MGRIYEPPVFVREGTLVTLGGADAAIIGAFLLHGFSMGYILRISVPIVVINAIEGRNAHVAPAPLPNVQEQQGQRADSETERSRSPSPRQDSNVAHGRPQDEHLPGYVEPTTVGSYEYSVV